MINKVKALTDQERVSRMWLMVQKAAEVARQRRKDEHERFDRESDAMREAWSLLGHLNNLPLTFSHGERAALHVEFWGLSSKDNKVSGVSGTVFDRGQDFEVFSASWDWTSGQTVCRVATHDMKAEDRGPDGLGIPCTPEHAVHVAVNAVSALLDVPEEVKNEFAL